MSDLLTLPFSPLLALLATASLVMGCGLLLGNTRRISPSLRHTILLASACGALALPLLSVASPRWDAPILPAIEQRHAPPAAERTGLAHARSAAGRGEMTPARTAQVAGVASANTRREALDYRAIAKILLIATWLLGTVGMLARLLVGHVRLRAIAARSWEPDDTSWTRLLEAEQRLAGMSRRVRLLVSPAATTPVTWGTRNPVVLLPEDALEWTAERRRIVLRHELVHVARGDALAQSVAALACAVYWFHPLALIAAKRMRIECERACDERVIALGTQPREYASHLLDVARAAREMSAPGLLSLAMARPSELEGRLVDLLNTTHPRATPTRRARTIAISLPLALAIVGSAFHPVPRAPTQAGLPGASTSSSAVMAPVPVVAREASPALRAENSFEASLPAHAGDASSAILQTASDLTGRIPQEGRREDGLPPNVQILLRADLTLPSSAPVQAVVSGEENLVLVNDRFALPLDLRTAIELVKQIRVKYGRDIPGDIVRIPLASNTGRTMTQRDAEPYAHLLQRLVTAPIEEVNGRPAARHQLFEEHPEVEVAVSDSTLGRLMRRSP